MQPKISVIIPNFNHSEFLEQRISSVINQTYQNIEIILLDDASSDTSRTILESYKSHPKVAHVVYNEHNSGSPFKQWQKGIELATGNYVWIAESDDYCELNFLELLVPKTETSGLVYSQSYDVNEKGEIIGDRLDYTKPFESNLWEKDFDIEGTQLIEQYMIYKNVIPNASAVLFKRNLIDADIFSEDLVEMRMCGDWLFWTMISAKTKVSFINQHLNYFRKHEKVSRTHDSKAKKVKRCLEEKTIRLHIADHYSIINKGADKLLYQRWFKTHRSTSIFNSSFYDVCLPYTTPFSLLRKFLSYKLT